MSVQLALSWHGLLKHSFMSIKHKQNTFRRPLEAVTNAKLEERKLALLVQLSPFPENPILQ